MSHPMDDSHLRTIITVVNYRIPSMRFAPVLLPGKSTLFMGLSVSNTTERRGQRNY